MLECLVWCLGWVLLIKVTSKALMFMYQAFLMKELNLLQRYGKGSWAFVTGSTDGIGLEFARQLARRGFNILISGRNEEKIGQRIKELSNECPKVSFRGVLVDFGKSDEKSFLETLDAAMKGIDVALIVQNVGVFNGEPIGKRPEAELVNTVKINSLTHFQIMNHYMPKLNARKTRSGFLDVSSCMTFYPHEQFHVHAATKTPHRFLTNGAYLSGDFANVDILCLTPGYTKTAMLPQIKLSPLTSPTEEVVEGGLKALGNVAQTYGSKRHILNGVIRETLSFVLPQRLWKDVLTRFENYLRTVET